MFEEKTYAEALPPSVFWQVRLTNKQEWNVAAPTFKVAARLAIRGEVRRLLAHGLSAPRIRRLNLEADVHPVAPTVYQN